MPRKKKGPEEGSPPDMVDIFEETAESDAAETKAGQAAKHVKACHLLSREAEKRLGAARLETSPSSAIKHDLERVLELCGEMHDSARLALEAIDL